MSKTNDKPATRHLFALSPELEAMHKIDSLLAALPEDQQQRVIAWLLSKRNVSGAVSFPNCNAVPMKPIPQHRPAPYHIEDDPNV